MLAFLSDYNFVPYFLPCDIEQLWLYLKQIVFEAILLFTPKVSSRPYERPK